MTKKIIYIDMDNTLVDFQSGIDLLSNEQKEQFQGRYDEVPGIFSKMRPMKGAIEGVELLAKHYDVYVLSTAPWNNPSAWSDKLLWIKEYLGETCYKRLILSHHKHLNKGDFLIDDREKNGAGKFEGELILFGSEQYPDWNSVLKYLNQKNMIMRKFDDLKNLIDENGKFIGSDEAKKSSIEAAEALAESILGATLSVRGKRFIIRMLEIYYGGIGDDAHDWYRTRFTYKTSKYKEQTEVQNKEGFRVYLSSMDVEDAYTRFDIVVGHEGVPVSFLIRSVWDSDFNLIGDKNGSPNKILKALNLSAEDHDEIIGLENSNSDIIIENTSNKIKKDKGFSVKRQRRQNLNSKFEEDNGVQWNFYLE